MKKKRMPVSVEERRPLLDARREAKMTSSAHAYVRGNTRRFYEWLVSTRGQSLPDAPSIWIGGDCHVGNLGPVAAKDGQTEIALRDLDQTVIGSPAHDVTRLALSLAMAVRASGLPGSVTARVVECLSRGYEEVLEARAADRKIAPGKPPPLVMQALRAADSRSRHVLLKQSVGKDAQRIPIGRRFWPLTGDERAAVEKLIASEKVRRLVASLASRDDDASVDLVDAAYWVKGCSSLGLWRCAALVSVGEKGGKEALSLIDIKEARSAVAPRAKSAAPYKHHGERVVDGARALSPPLGERMVHATLLDKHLFVREILPQDSKFELDALTAEEALALSHYLGGVVGLAHARQMESAACATWLESFRHELARNLNAPAWLWAAVVDLVALHEGAYLEHCREHALGSGEQEIAAADETVVSHHVTAD